MSTVQSQNTHLTLDADGASSEIKLQTNGTDKVTVSSAGNVGIGTSSPTSKLHIDTGTTGQITLEDSATPANNYVGIEFGDNLVLAADEDNLRTGSSIRFKVDATERMRILDTGGITFNGDTAAANALDDYEEGTFTPDFSASTAPTGVTYSSRSGKYTKIGDMVHFNVYMAVSSVGTGGSGTLYIGTLPFIAKATGSNYAVVNTINLEALTSSFTGYNTAGLIPNNAYNLRPYYNNWGTGGMNVLQWSHIKAGTILRLSGTYHTDT